MKDLTEVQADRLQRFFADWRGIRSLNPPGLLAERLGLFFTAMRTLSGPQRSGPAVGLDLGKLSAAFGALHTPLAQAKANGLFLNAWTAAGLKRDEVRNASVLASLLDPQLCPVTGPAFLWNLLTNAGGDLMTLTSRRALANGYTVRTEECPLGSGENRVDVSVEGEGFLLFIEVKIDAGEGHAQLERYDSVLRAKADLTGTRPALIYLSPRAPARLPANAAHLTWRNVAAAAQAAGKPARGAQRTIAQELVTQFSNHIAAFKGSNDASTRTGPAPDQQSG